MFTTRASRAVLAAIALVAAGAAVAARQGAAAAQRLAVDFAVVAPDGLPVEDLRPGEVTIRLNNATRRILELRRVTAAQAVAPQQSAAALAGGPATALAPPYATNERDASGRSFVILLDELSLLAGQAALVRNAVEGLLEDLGPADRTLVLALPYGGIRAPFTGDRERLRAAVESIVGQGDRGETGSAMAERTRAFLETLQAFLQGQAGRRTPLTVVLFTAGLAAPRRDAPMALAPGRGELLVDHFKWVAESAGAARASFYILAPADLKVNAAVWQQNIAGRDYLGSDNPLEGIEHLAGATRGHRLPLDAKGSASLDRVARETSSYYVAEIEPERGEVLGRSRPFEVRVSRPGVEVRARPLVTFSESRRASSPVLEDLLLSGGPVNELRLRAGAFVVREDQGRLRAGVLVEPLEREATLAAASAVLVGPEGRVAARWTAPDAARRPLLGALAAPPGTYTVRVAAVDQAGRPGTVDQPMQLSLVPVGPLSLGSLVLGVSRPDGVAPQLEFGPEPAAIASFDIYGGEGGLGLSAAVEIARQPEGPAVVTLPLALSRATHDRVVATATIPLGALAEGDYEVRAVVRLQDGTSGRVSRTLRKRLPR